ncbi:MAG: ribulose-phosphate 3-epimerase [Streptococcaceae bacterium]|jgi:ribulose-phosphate 3-epimerase|nr:ribulose-phosphate 3-epimerase [Streptococcaceae bacterium]
MKIAPSILSADFANLERDIQLVETSGADYIHVDVMDGHFVDNITLGPNIVSAIRPVTKLPLDCHLMVEKPEKFITAFAKAGADIISIHVEATPHIHGALFQIKQAGIKASVVLNPGTPVGAILDVLSLVDQVLVMTVNPGFGGQSFIKEALDKVKFLAEFRQQQQLSFDIEVDGGVDETTIALCKAAGANVFVAGSFIYDSENPAGQIAKLKAQLHG